MSRHGYDDYDSADTEEAVLFNGRWRGQVTSAMRGKRGQAFLKEALAALDNMEPKELIVGEFRHEGQFCTLGAVAKERGMDILELENLEDDDIGDHFNIARAMACEIMFNNDEGNAWEETPAMRWTRMRRWLVRNIKETEDAS